MTPPDFGMNRLAGVPRLSAILLESYRPFAGFMAPLPLVPTVPPNALAGPQVVASLPPQMILVRNAEQTANERPPGGGAWRDYCARKSGVVPRECSHCGSCDRELVGAHVEMVGLEHWGSHISVLCCACNSLPGEFAVPLLSLVSIDARE